MVNNEPAASAEAPAAPADALAGLPAAAPAQIDAEVEARGMACPLPILKAKKAIIEVPKDGTLEVLSTDPGSVADFQAFCRTTGNTMVETGEAAGVYRFVIRHTA